MLYIFNLHRIPSCHTLSKALEISGKTPLTSIVGSESKDKFILWTIDNNYEIYESPWRKSDWHFVKS